MDVNLLRAIREEYRLNVSQFAKLLCVKPPTVYSWESGRTTPGPHERTILWRLWQAAHNPPERQRAFNAIDRALKLPEATPPPPLPTQDANANDFAKGMLVGAGLAVLLSALFGGD